jgi:hypothetical protein
MLTNTWRHRLDSTGSMLRRAALTVGIGSCTVVAASTIWGWVTDEPIDVAGPARSAVNRTALIGSYAEGCVTRWLTATATHPQTLQDCWSLRDQMRLPTTAPVIVSSPAVSAVTLVEDRGAVQQWSAVITVSERPFEAATPHTAHYRMPVIYSNYGPRGTTLPARVNGPGAGADAALAYPTAVADTSPVFTTVAGFLTSYLTTGGGLERYVTADSGLLPAADYRTVRVTKLLANRGVSDHDVPADGTTVHVLATADAVTSQFAPIQLNYPIVLKVTGGRWSVAGLDYAPLLADDAELSPVIPTATAPR